MEQLLEQTADIADLETLDHVPQAFLDEFEQDADAELAATLHEFDGILDEVVAEQRRNARLPMPAQLAGKLLTVAVIGRKR